MVGTASLEHGFVNTATTSDNADHGTVGAGDDLFGPGRQLDPCPLGVGVVGDDRGVVAAGSRYLATISGLFLQIADDSSLGHRSNRHHVTDRNLKAN